MPTRMNNNSTRPIPKSKVIRQCRYAAIAGGGFFTVAARRNDMSKNQLPTEDERPVCALFQAIYAAGVLRPIDLRTMLRSPLTLRNNTRMIIRSGAHDDYDAPGVAFASKLSCRS